MHVISTFPPQAATAARPGAADPSCTAGLHPATLAGYAVEGWAPGQMPAIGVVENGAVVFHNDAGAMTADLDGDGKPEYFRSCLSSEGVHFTVWTGRPFEGRLRWHEYYSLGYDVEPDCRPEETVSPK